MTVAFRRKFRDATSFSSALAVGAGLVAVFTRTVLLFMQPEVRSGNNLARKWARMIVPASLEDVLLSLTICLVLFATLLFTKRFRWVVAGLGVTAVLAPIVLSCLNVELVSLFGVPLTVDMIYYSDLFGSAHGRAALVKAAPSYIYALAVISICGCVVLTLCLQRLFRFIPAKLVFASMLASEIVLITAYNLWLPTAAQRANLLPAMYRSSAISLLASFVALRDTSFLSAASHEPSGSLAPFQVSEPLNKVSQSEKIAGIIIIVLESTAAQYLDVYGSNTNTTPNLSRLMQRSVVFDNAYAHYPNSASSMVSLVTSLFPVISPVPLSVEAPSVPVASLPLILKQNGFTTSLFYSSDLRFQNVAGFLAGRGFDVMQDYRGRDCGSIIQNTTEFNSLGSTDQCTMLSLIEWIRNVPKDQRYFGLLWTFQSHYPYFDTGTPEDVVVPKGLDEWTEQHLRRYLGAIKEADRQVGELIAELKRTGRLDSTLLIVLGDHGEGLGQHGSYGHGKLFDEVTRIPLLIAGPGVESGQRTRRATGIVDLAPSILDLLGVPVPADWQGHSVFGDSTSHKIPLFTSWAGYKLGFKEADKKAIFYTNENRVELYDTSNDPEEKQDISSNRTEDAAYAREWLSWWATHQGRLIKDLSDR